MWGQSSIVARNIMTSALRRGGHDIGGVPGAVSWPCIYKLYKRD